MKVFIGLLILCGTYSTQSASVKILQSNILPIPPCYDQQDGALISVPGECSQFYICLNGDGVLSSCGAKLHFDPISGTCIEASRSLCLEKQEVTVVETSPQKPAMIQNICAGKAIGAFVPSKINCNEYYVCIGSNPMLKKCKVEHHFNPDSRSCIAAELSQCVSKADTGVLVEEKREEPQVVVDTTLQVIKKKKKQHQQKAPVETIIFAETICLGQPNGAMFAAPGSCSKYFACLQQKAFEQSCGQRHFDPSGRSCIEADTSSCVEGQVVGNLGIAVKAIKVEDEAVDEPMPHLLNSVGNTFLGTDNDGVFVGNANIDIQNTGVVSTTNVASASSNIIAGNADLGSYNSYYVTNNGNGTQNKAILSQGLAIQGQNTSIGDTDFGNYNSGIFVGNANLAINNTGTISSANIVTASKDVVVGNLALGYSNTYYINGSNLIGNNRTIPIKQTGLPVNKKTVSHIDNVDIVVSSSGIVSDFDGVKNASDSVSGGIGDTDLGGSNSGIFIGNANVNISNSGYITDVNLVSGSSNVVVGNANLGNNNEVVVQELPIEKENKQIVLAIVDEDSAEACDGIPSGTLMARPGNCREFLTCESDVAFVGQCPRGLHFNAQAKFCDWPESAGCV